MYRVYLVIVIFMTILLMSCSSSETIEYDLEFVLIVQDSTKVKYQTWVTETIRAASHYVSAGDYEHPEHLVARVVEEGKELFGKRELCLVINRAFHGCNGNYTMPLVFIQEKDLNVEQKAIFDSLRKKFKI